MKSLAFFCIGALSLAAGRAADPETEMRAAVDDLVNLPSYSWRRWTEMPTKEEFDAAKDAGFRGLGLPAAAVITGKTDRDNFSIWTATRFNIEVVGVFHDRRGVVDYGEGWKSWEDVRRERTPRNVSGTQEKGQRMLRQRLAMSLASTGFLSPSAQLRGVLAAGLVGFYQADDLLWAEFSPEGARRILLQESAESIWSSSGVTAQKAKGTVQLWVRAGHVVRFEVHIEGIVSAQNPRPAISSSMNYTRITTFSDHGAAEMSIPREARDALSADISAQTPTRRPQWPSSASTARP